MRRRGGFTLIEMLVVIAIIGILAQMLFPALLRARNAALGIVCANQEKQLGMYIQQYAFDNWGVMPQSRHRRWDNEKWRWGSSYTILMETLHRHCFPEERVQYGDYLMEGTYNMDTAINVKKDITAKSPIATCPVVKGEGRRHDFDQSSYDNSYAGPDGEQSALGAWEVFVRQRQHRSPSKLYMLLETNNSFIAPWNSENSGYPIGDTGFQYRHNDATNVLYADGHVKSENPFLLNRGKHLGYYDAAHKQSKFTNDARWYYYGQNVVK